MFMCKRVLSAAVFLVAAFCAGAAPSAHAAGAGRVKVLVLDVKSKDLSASEVETLTSLITAQLSRYQQLDVLSSVDIHRLVDLESQKQTVGCDSGSCLSELAGALGAELVFFGQAGKLGTTVVLTLNVFDAKKNEAVGRQPVEARDISQLPDLVGPAIDRMVQPLFQSLRGGAPMVAPTDVAPIKTAPTVVLTARAKEVFDQQEMDICVDSGDRLKWWFCDKKDRYSENAFVRKYRETTGASDLDRAEKNRNPNGMLIPGVMVGGGAALVVASLPIGYYTYVDKTTLPVLSQGDSSDSSSGGLGALLTIGGVSIGLGSAIYGGILLANAMDFTDGELTDHTLKEPEARDAAARYNDALADRINREYGTR
ncbi:MAG TPA: hypothetical protein VGO62_03235 [Myxococcota bacterium]